MNKLLPIVLGFFLTTLAIWAVMSQNPFIHGILDSLDNLGYDLQLKAHIITQAPQPSPVIAIVDLDDRSLSVEGHWPWPRTKLAELTDKLTQSGAVVVAFDMFFSEKDPNPVDMVLTKVSTEQNVDPNVVTFLQNSIPMFNYDETFAASLAQSNKILAISFLPNTQTQNTLPAPLLTLTSLQSAELNLYKAKGYIASIPILQNAAKKGAFINILADGDGIFRHAPLLIEYQKAIYPSLALQAVMSFISSPIKIIAPKYDRTHKLEGIQVGNTIVPVDNTGQALIPFIGKSYTFPFYSATDVLHDKIGKNELSGKIIFVGTSATGMGDLKPTSVQNPFPGVEIQATMANGMLDNNFSYKPDWTFGATILMIVVFGFISSIAFPLMGPRSLGLVIIIFPVLCLVVNSYIWEHTGLVLSILVPVLMVTVSAILNIIWGYLFETRRRERIKAMFGQYVPEKHIEEMLKSGSGFGLRGEDREMSVLFADIRSFTTISEGLTATQLVELLNTFFTPMTEIIFKNQGTIDKYVGDLIMAFWGAPLKDKSHASHAIESAISMQEKVKDLDVLFKEKNWPEIQIGIGINSGSMSVGDMGSQYRRNYTVLGDNVNLASRVEGLTKFYGAKIMVTEFTQHDQKAFIFRKLDRVKVKGKSRGVEIYEVLGRSKNLTPALEQELKQYHLGLEAYFSLRFEEAFEIMDALHKEHPHEKIYKIYVERLQEFKLNPMPADWDGIFVHLSK